MYLMDEALSQMHAEGRAQTVLTVFDLRGFGCVAAASGASGNTLTVHLVALVVAPRMQTFRSFASSSSTLRCCCTKQVVISSSNARFAGSCLTFIPSASARCC